MNNILYLLNHKTLTDFEVPILIKKGYGVYIPKKYKSLASVNSINYTTVNFFDNFLHIPPDEISQLNQIDWFSNKVLSLDVIDLINRYFKYIFITLLTEAPLLNQLINRFHGKIYYRLFGLAGNGSYVKNVNKYTDPNVGYIFSYSEIYTFEKKLSNFFNSNNSLVISLGLSNSLVNQLSNSHTSSNGKIAFVCSRIDPKCKYYFNIYQNFVKEFKNFSYTIFGKNNEAVKANPNVRNNLPDNEFYSSISACSSMYYHGKEPRHLHYHPLEAIVMGLPVVFHSESLLTSYLGNSPGKCKNMEEVRDKVNRIIQNDSILVKEILAEQNIAYQQLIQSNNKDIFNDLLG